VPSPTTSNQLMIVRGLRGRCPRCGARWARTRLVSPAPVCANCSLPLDAEQGGFTNALVFNWVVAVLVVVAVFVVLMVDLLGDGEANPWPYLVVGAIACTAIPVWSYPRSRTLWCAIDLAARR
jgi:uncharacterized protein (DUF983 family)